MSVLISNTDYHFYYNLKSKKLQLKNEMCFVFVTMHISANEILLNFTGISNCLLYFFDSEQLSQHAGNKPWIVDKYYFHNITSAYTIY